MMGRLKRSWTIFKTSVGILKRNKKLLVFPAIEIVGFIWLLFFFFMISTSFHYDSKAMPNGDAVVIKADNSFISYKYSQETKGGKICNAADSSNLSTFEKSKPGAFFYIPLSVIFYIFSMFVITFFNVAYYNEILRALNCNEVSIVRGFKFACSKIVPIMMWSLFAGVVGYIIKTISEKLGFGGKILMSLLGITWSVASVFVIPVIIREKNNINPVDYLKKSALAIKKTWGEGLVGYIGFGSLSLIVVLSSVMFLLLPLLILGYVLFLKDAAPLPPVLEACGIWVIMLIAYSYIVGVVEKIYLCSLYVYASEGVVPEGFSEADMDSAWKIKS